MVVSTADFRADIVARHALYDWASSATGGHQVSYDLWKKILFQLEEYPENRIWTLPLGNGWQVVRTGEALEVVPETTQDQRSDATGEEALPWSYANKSSSEDCTLVVTPPTTKLLSPDNFIFFKSTVGGAGMSSWKFTPPWRTGSSPSKLGHFLRGQKVPLHLRGSTPVVYCRNTGKDEVLLVAVLVNGRWVEDVAWSSDTNTVGSRSSEIAINLPPR